ncbi:PAS domain S-box protein [Paraburkholderia sp. RL17-337-BIB-A]|uniref:PAS domain S-box protein n=1 Tax=Paraburkholderia sp. RL17-337-BIB-A TaxID=3031636 RepID=UPI0038BD04BF
MTQINVASWRDFSAATKSGVAILSVVSAALLNHWMELHFVGTPISLFLCAIAFSTWFGGAGPCILAIAISLLTFDYFFVSPQHTFFVGAVGTVRLITFLLTSLFISGLGAMRNSTAKTLKRTHDELVGALQELREANLALEVENAERKRVHEKLISSEACLTEGQKISHTGSWRWNLSSEKLSWSEEHYRIFGYEPQAHVPSFESIAKRIHPDDRDEVQRTVQQAIQEWSRFECEYRIVLPDGSIRYVRGVGCPVGQQLSDSREYVGTTVDITARRKVEEQLRKSEQEFRTLAENLPDGVVRFDLNCRRIYVNPAYVRQSGIPADKALGNSLEANWRGDVPVEDFKNILQQVLKTGIPNQVFGVWKSQNGSNGHFAIQMVAERNSSGTIVGVLSIGRDVTSLKESEQRLEESRYQLRQLAVRMESVREEERKHLARELHDEFAQHLLAVRMRVSLLDHEFGRRIPALKTKVRDMVEIVDSTIKTVRNVVSTLRPAELDLGILSALECLVSEFTTQTNITCKLHRSPKNISLPEKTTIAIFRVAQEALRNVAKHANADRVDISFKSDKGELALEVRDNGSGFDPSIKKALSFGLVGIRERVLMLGGQVEITTAPGEGTSVQVRIPAITDR